MESQVMDFKMCVTKCDKYDQKQATRDDRYSLIFSSESIFTVSFQAIWDIPAGTVT